LNAGFRLLRLLERLAALVRRLGLGPVVDAVRDRVMPALGPFEAQIGPARLSGDTQPHLRYFDQLRDGREGYMAELLSAAAQPGQLVVDGGAHLGYVTQLAAARGARVIAFEPNPETRSLLERGLQRAGFAERVRVIPRALADRTEDRELYLSGGGDTSSLFDHPGSSGAVTVSCVRGDEIFGEDDRVAVLKLDIEGGEVRALEGMRETLARSADRIAIFVECNPGALEAAGTSPGALLDVLRQHGLEVSICDEEAHRLVPWDDAAIRGGSIVNLYAAAPR
jgi:FkbM family methyltransferase